jgi:hypothetical protein
VSRKFDFLKNAKTQPAEISGTQTSDSPAVQKSESPNVQVVELSHSRGRPAGKRTDPDYSQVTAYIRKSTHHGVKLRLLQEGQGREFSELVEELLAGWLQGLQGK